MFSNVHNPPPKFSSSIKLFPRSVWQRNSYSFENVIKIISVVGPVLFVLYIFLGFPLFQTYNSLSNKSELDLFAYLQHNDLIFLLKLLFASTLFSGLGLLFGMIHKKTIIFYSDFISFFLSAGFMLPTLLMVLGGD
ncbi:MAG: hypothetical protein KDC52_00080 [Ignavibacteriae bacterium]|nr:hypothetical protein [Ignavibacteriota bacterium]